MATLTADEPRDYQTSDIESYPVVATDIIYEGAAVGENGSGYARPLAAADPFLGFAIRQVDNSSGAAGDARVEVRTKGRIKVPITVAITDNDRVAVYASDDNTFTKTSAGNSKIGWVSRWISNSEAVVEFDATKA